MYEIDFRMKYPPICTLSDDEVDEGVWSDGPSEVEATTPTSTYSLFLLS